VTKLIFPVENVLSDQLETPAVEEILNLHLLAVVSTVYGVANLNAVTKAALLPTSDKSVVTQISRAVLETDALVVQTLATFSCSSTVTGRLVEALL
jgi:hypothetical protein